MSKTSPPLPPESGDNRNSSVPVRAAIYARMSTEHQKYSVENQFIAFNKYAAQHGVVIVKEYIDDGKSGLTLRGRPALQQMLHDVDSGNPGFEIILVLDVTRWGRFQNPDEAAAYEFHCMQAGIHVEYVAEEFSNDGSFSAIISKTLKRIMSGERSRELSVKVFGGQCTLIGKGYRQGGHAGYGLRRLMIDEDHNPKMELAYGDRKSLQTDRVILVPGPDEEVENVRWMYRAFTKEGLTEKQIATILNQRGIKTDLGRDWTRDTVHQVLTNEKYIGHNVYNRRSFKLKHKHVKNPPEEWVRKDNAFEAIVDTSHFYAAQKIILERNRKFDNDEMLARLKALYEEKGMLSGFIINQAADMPSSTCYSHRFGGLLKAYQLIGYTPATDYSFIEVNRHLRSVHADMMQDVMQKIIDLGGDVEIDEETDILTINQYLRVSVAISRCQTTKSGMYRWKVRLDTGLRPDITIVVRMNETNDAAVDYYLLPALDVENPQLRLLEDNSLTLDAYRFDTLEPFFLLAEQVDIMEVA